MYYLVIAAARMAGLDLNALRVIYAVFIIKYNYI